MLIRDHWISAFAGHHRLRTAQQQINRDRGDNNERSEQDRESLAEAGFIFNINLNVGCDLWGNM